MPKLLLLALIALACIGYSYLCFFKPEKVKWVSTNPMNGNYYREVNTLHAYGFGITGLILLLVVVVKLLN